MILGEWAGGEGRGSGYGRCISSMFICSYPTCYIILATLYTLLKMQIHSITSNASFYSWLVILHTRDG